MGDAEVVDNAFIRSWWGSDFIRSLGGGRLSRKSNEIFWTAFWSYARMVFVIVTSYRSPSSIYYRLVGSEGVPDFSSLCFIGMNKPISKLQPGPILPSCLSPPLPASMSVLPLSRGSRLPSTLKRWRSLDPCRPCLTGPFIWPLKAHLTASFHGDACWLPSNASKLCFHEAILVLWQALAIPSR